MKLCIIGAKNGSVRRLKQYHLQRVEYVLLSSPLVTVYDLDMALVMIISGDIIFTFNLSALIATLLVAVF